MVWCEEVEKHSKIFDLQKSHVRCLIYFVIYYLRTTYINQEDYDRLRMGGLWRLMGMTMIR